MRNSRGAIGGRPVLALIPARGGSKGIKAKNLQQIAGQTLVEIALSAALDARSVDHVFLSSDDEAILAIGRKLGVELIVRPEVFASDTASANDVVRHFVETIPQKMIEEDPYIAYLQPTSPLRTAQHIDAAIAMLADSDRRSIISVSEALKSPFKMFRLDEGGNLQSLFAEDLSNARRQDLPAAYIPNGAIYVFRVSDFEVRRGFPSNGSLPFVMNQTDSIDIDSEEDLQYVKRIMEMTNG